MGPRNDTAVVFRTSTLRPRHGLELVTKQVMTTYLLSQCLKSGPCVLPPPGYTHSNRFTWTNHDPVENGVTNSATDTWDGGSLSQSTMSQSYSRVSL